MTIKYFVWEPSTLGPVGRIWHDMQTDGNGKPQPTIAAPIPLLDSDSRSIDELKEAYPYGSSTST